MEGEAAVYSVGPFAGYIFPVQNAMFIVRVSMTSELWVPNA